MGMNSDGRIISNVIRDLCTDFLAKTESFTREKTAVKCWKFIDCPQEIMNVCPAVLQNSERWCWLAAGALRGKNLSTILMKPVLSCTQCDFYKAAQHIRGGELDKIAV